MINIKMNKKYIYSLLPVIIFLLSANAFSQGKKERSGANNSYIQYQGRIGMDNPGIAEIYWPGSSIKIRFKGTGIKAILKDQRGNNYYNIIVDDDSVHVL